MNHEGGSTPGGVIVLSAALDLDTRTCTTTPLVHSSLERRANTAHWVHYHSYTSDTHHVASSSEVQKSSVRDLCDMPSAPRGNRNYQLLNMWYGAAVSGQRSVESGLVQQFVTAYSQGQPGTL